MKISVYLKPKNVFHEAKNRLMYEVIPIILGNNSKDRFLNLGYYKESNDFEVKELDTENSLHISLYNELLRHVETNNKDVLEVGCGLGGGAYFLTHYKPFKTYTGIDISASNIFNNNKYLAKDNIRFKRGDARSLPFDKDSFDVVFNLESSHRYGNVIKFYEQVDKVLKNGGVFAYSDFGSQGFFDNALSFFNSKNYTIEHDIDITENVIQSLDINRENVLNKLNSKHKFLFRVLGRKWLKNGVFDKESINYQNLQTRTYLYKIYILKNP